jgi:DNA-binding winged helix-turn-helix (wHTH) protein
MMPISRSLINKFGDFEFDRDRLALYHRGELIKVEKKALEVLAVLLEHPRLLTSTQEIIETIWSDNPIGVTSTHLAQSVSKLRRVLAQYDPGVSYIETVKGRGYMFSADVERLSAREGSPAVVLPDLSTVEQASETLNEATSAQSAPRPFRFAWAVVGVLAVGLISAWIMYPNNDDAEVRRVVKESQMFESLVLYRDPSAFKESDLDKYWTAETDPNSNYDRQHIRIGVHKLLEDGRHYGSETKNEQFDFQAVDVAADGQMAVVKTLEKWFIAEYKTDGTLLRNRNVGPYFVSYVLRKKDGRWLIEKSTTARANPLTPQLERAELLTEAKSGQEFFVRLTGWRFEPQNILVKVVGPGCPEIKPCSVPNSAIRIHSELSETSLDRVPLTLASGEYALSVQNGESPASNSLSITVP